MTIFKKGDSMTDSLREFEHKGRRFTIKSNRHHGTEMVSFHLTRNDGVQVVPDTLLLPYDPMMHGKDIAAVFEMLEVYVKSQ